MTILFIYTQVVTFSKHKIAIYEEFFCIMTVYDGQKKTKSAINVVYMNCKKWLVDVIDFSGQFGVYTTEAAGDPFEIELLLRSMRT